MSETWLYSNISDSAVQLDGLTFLEDRSRSSVVRGGDLCHVFELNKIVMDVVRNHLLQLLFQSEY